MVSAILIDLFGGYILYTVSEILRIGNGTCMTMTSFLVRYTASSVCFVRSSRFLRPWFTRKLISSPSVQRAVGSAS